MLNLTHENFIKARNYIITHSDDINHAWFTYNFETVDTDIFMDALLDLPTDEAVARKGEVLAAVNKICSWAQPLKH